MIKSPVHEEVSHVTLFYWRHKILSALKQIPVESFRGIVELDETYFLYSEKGRKHITERKPRKRGGKAKYRGISNDQICVLVARDRQKMTYSGVLGRGRIRTSKLNEEVGCLLSESNVLCTDSWRAFSSFANEKGLSHYRFKSDGKQRVKGAWFRYLDSKEYENTMANKKNMLITSCLYPVGQTNVNLRQSTSLG